MSSATDSKQEALRKLVIDAVRSQVTECLEASNKDGSKLQNEILTTVMMISQRLDTLEQLVQGTKKPVKSGAERKTGTGRAQKGGDAGDEASRVQNCMQFFKYAYVNLPEFYEEYSEKETVKQAIDGKDFKNKDGDDLKKAEATEAWKNFGKEEKEEIKNQFKKWKDDRERNSEPAQLEEETKETEAADEPAEDAEVEPEPEKPKTPAKKPAASPAKKPSTPAATPAKKPATPAASPAKKAATPAKKAGK